MFVSHCVEEVESSVVQSGAGGRVQIVHHCLQLHFTHSIPEGRPVLSQGLHRHELQGAVAAPQKAKHIWINGVLQIPHNFNIAKILMWTG